MRSKYVNPNLGNEDDVGLSFADAAAAILADEAESRHAGGADLPMTTWAVRNPFQTVGAHRTAIIHGFLVWDWTENLIAGGEDEKEEI